MVVILYPSVFIWNYIIQNILEALLVIGLLLSTYLWVKFHVKDDPLVLYTYEVSMILGVYIKPWTQT